MLKDTTIIKETGVLTGERMLNKNNEVLIFLIMIMKILVKVKHLQYQFQNLNFLTLVLIRKKNS